MEQRFGSFGVLVTTDNIPHSVDVIGWLSPPINMKKEQHKDFCEKLVKLLQDYVVEIEL